jgi:hypothetical protein
LSGDLTSTTTLGHHPATALYLNFALGRPIRSPSEDEPVATVGIEHMVQTVKDEPPPSLIESTRKILFMRVIEKSSSFYADESDSPVRELTLHYGTISNMIGEAAA